MSKKKIRIESKSEKQRKLWLILVSFLTEETMLSSWFNDSWS